MTSKRLIKNYHHCTVEVRCMHLAWCSNPFVVFVKLYFWQLFWQKGSFLPSLSVMNLQSKCPFSGVAIRNTGDGTAGHERYEEGGQKLFAERRLYYTCTVHVVFK